MHPYGRILHVRHGRIVLLIALAVIACREDVESSYRTYREAAADGAISRGWLPAWLPTTSTEIGERHDLDTNATFASFIYGTAEPREFLATCHRTSLAPLPSQRRWRVNEGEWSRLQFYRCDEKATFADGHAEVRATWVAIDHARTKAYFWR